MVVGNSGDEDSATEDDSSGEDEDESMEDEEDGEEGEKEEGMIVEDGKCGKYDCPNFIVTKPQTLEEGGDCETSGEEDWVQGIGEQAAPDVGS